MLNLDANRVYMVQAHTPGLNCPVNEVSTGKNMDRVVSDIKNRYPCFKRIIIFDADTKEAVGLIRS